MKKLADISAFEGIQNRANASMGSGLSVFNAVTLDKADPGFDQVYRVVSGGNDKEAIRIISTIKRGGPQAINAFMKAFQAANQRALGNSGGQSGLPSSTIITTDQEIRRIYEYCSGKFAPGQERTGDSTFGRPAGMGPAEEGPETRTLSVK